MSQWPHPFFHEHQWLHETSHHLPSDFLFSGSPLMMSWETRTSAPFLVLDWLISFACKSCQWGPGVRWPNYVKHTIHYRSDGTLGEWNESVTDWDMEGKRRVCEKEEHWDKLWEVNWNRRWKKKTMIGKGEDWYGVWGENKKRTRWIEEETANVNGA